MARLKRSDPQNTRVPAGQMLTLTEFGLIVWFRTLRDSVYSGKRCFSSTFHDENKFRVGHAGGRYRGESIV